ncbi:MAG: 3'-5' exonuclease [Candidatus Margulisiibacteriota bacterium]
MSDLLKDKEFLKLEKDFPFLSRLRKQTEIDKLPYVIVDIETTGLEPKTSEIIEIGAIKTEGKNAKDAWQTLISYSQDLPPEIIRITGINDRMLKEKPSIDKALEEFLAFSADHILVAHNSDFDLSFLKRHVSKYLKKELENRVLCTLKLARILVPGLKNYKLGTIAEHFKIPVPSAHRAMGDCEATYGLWNKLIDILLSKNIRSISLVEEMMK